MAVRNVLCDSHGPKKGERPQRPHPISLSCVKPRDIAPTDSALIRTAYGKAKLDLWPDSDGLSKQ